MKKLTYILIGLLLLNSCGQDNTSEEKTTTVTKNETIVVPEKSYKIISEVDNSTNTYTKCNIDVELKGKITKEELTAIGNEIRETRKNYGKLWILYYLPGMTVGSGAWAYTHFTPELEVKIMGTTEAEDKKMNEVTAEGETIGKWQDTRPYGGLMLIYKKENKIFMKQTFSDGSSMDDEFVKKNFNGKDRYEPKQNKHKEYYLVESNGNLGMYGENGKFAEATKKD